MSKRHDGAPWPLGSFFLPAAHHSFPCPPSSFLLLHFICLENRVFEFMLIVLSSLFSFTLTFLFPCLCLFLWFGSVEMRHSVTQLNYLFRKTLDNLLYSLTSPQGISLSSLIPSLAKLPYPTDKLKGWLPLYTMVTFRPDINYATVKKRAARQATILTGLSRIGVAVLGAAGAWLMWSTTEMVLNLFGQK